MITVTTSEYLCFVIRTRKWELCGKLFNVQRTRHTHSDIGACGSQRSSHPMRNEVDAIIAHVGTHSVELTHTKCTHSAFFVTSKIVYLPSKRVHRQTDRAVIVDSRVYTAISWHIIIRTSVVVHDFSSWTHDANFLGSQNCIIEKILLLGEKLSTRTWNVRPGNLVYRDKVTPGPGTRYTIYYIFIYIL